MMFFRPSASGVFGATDLLAFSEQLRIERECFQQSAYTTRLQQSPEISLAMQIPTQNKIG
jgi:hypothetical protein